MKESPQTHHTPSQPPSHQRKPQKQNQPCLPRHPCPTITIAIGAQPCLLNRIDDKHAETAADAWDPVDEADIDILGAVVGGGAVGGGIDEEEKSEGELLGEELAVICGGEEGTGDAREQDR